jgi:hypothetical protein
MTDEPKTKRVGKFQIPAHWIDGASKRPGSQTAFIIGGVKPPTKPQDDGELPKRDDDKADK